MKNCFGEKESLRLVEGKLLRRGFTTGSCAAAAAKAAAIMLFSQKPCESVSINTPKGTVLNLSVINQEFSKESASCAVIKDSGDDPDITNGALVYACVSFNHFEILIKGGAGIGKVTKPGLNQPVGEYAINSVPRAMINEACKEVCKEYGYSGGLDITISIPNGEESAKKTFNPKLGIEGGLSILGTTGIVEPMSERAIVSTIRAELSIIKESGMDCVILTIGNYGEAFAKDKLSLKLEAHVKCSNFIGETLSAAAELKFKKVLLIGHIGKIVKLGIGILNTHSSYGDGRMETLISCALTAGADLDILHRISKCVSVDGALDILDGAGLTEKALSILKMRIEDTLLRHLSPDADMGLISFRGLGEKAEICIVNDRVKSMAEGFK